MPETNAERQEFRFPDEAPNKAVDPELEIEIVDDTPEQDRGREPLPKEMVEELENDDLAEYSDKVKKRLSQMKKVWHDERREKERAAREKEEAVQFAQRVLEENRKLRGRVGQGEKKILEEGTKAVAVELKAAKDKLKQALDAGDVDAIVTAQEELADVKLRQRELEKFTPSLQESEEGVEDTQQTSASGRVIVDPKAEAWRDKNTWFGNDEEMTALALGLHEKLVRSGVDPRSDDYYDKLNKTMRKRFPEYEWEDAMETRETNRGKPAARARPATTVAPVSRSTAPRQVKLTPSQVALAAKLGLSPQDYAKELLKLENNNG
jgi:hypothetical protein